MLCAVNYNTVEEGLKDKIAEVATAEGIFQREEDHLNVVDHNKDTQAHISMINSQFGEDVIQKTDDPNKYLIAPSGDLVQSYLDHYQEPFIQRALELSKDLPEMYRIGFVTNPRGALRDISEQLYGIVGDEIHHMGGLEERMVEVFGQDLVDLAKEMYPPSATNTFLSASAYSAKVLSPENLQIFKRLQNAGLVSKKSFTFMRKGKDKTFYTIPKDVFYNTASLFKAEPIYRKNLNKKLVLDNFIKNNNLKFLRTIETEDAILIELGDFAGDTFTPYESLPSETQSSKAGQLTQQKVLTFLGNIGFNNIEDVKSLVHNGSEIEGDAYVDMIKGVMQIVEGKRDVTLPEEAMHILVELIQKSDPILFSKLEKDVVNYDLYYKVIRDTAYTTNKLYQKEDGTVDYSKLKKEAIAKLLAEFLIGNTEQTIESREKVQRVSSWWKDIIDWIMAKFSKYKNPFQEALSRLEQDNTEFGVFSDLSATDTFLSAVRKSVETRDKEYEATRDVYDILRTSAAKEGFSKVDDEYIKDGKVWEGGRVSDLVQSYYKELFKNKPLDESKREYYDMLATDGTFVHSLFEDAIRASIDGETGLLKQIPSALNESLHINETGSKMANQVMKYVQQFLSRFPEGTRFLSETIVHDKMNNRLGTIDFIAVEPHIHEDESITPKVSIFDWKTMLLEDLEGAKDYKKQGIEIQVTEYRNILRNNYNVQEFNKIRAIPIKRQYQKSSDGELHLIGLEIGNVDAAKITKPYLRPIISQNESTGSQEKDNLVQALGGIYNKFVGILRDEKIPNRQVLSEINNAIYELRVSNTIKSLNVYLQDLQGKIDNLTKLISLEKKTDKDTISDLLGDISLFQSIFEGLAPAKLLRTEESIPERDRITLSNVISRLDIRVEKLKQERARLLNIQAENNNIYTLLLPEKVVTGATRWFRAMGNQDIASVKLLYSLTKKAYNRIDLETGDELKKIEDLKYLFDKFIKDKGLSTKDAIGRIVNYEKGTLHSKISKDFYEKRQKIFDSKNKKAILDFVKENYNFDEYSKWYDESLKEQMAFWKSQTYSEDKEEDGRIKVWKKNEFEKNYNINKHPLTAFGRNNTLLWSRNIREDLWLSKEYQELQKPENEVLNKMHQFFVEKNRQLFDVGAIEEWQIYNFLPNVRKGLADIFSFKEKDWLSKMKDLTINKYENFKKSLTVQDYELNYSSKVDEITGEKLGERFIPYVGYIAPEDKSFDIFSIYALMSKEISKEKYLSENDEMIRALMHIERAKQNFETNKYGKLAKRGEKPIISQQRGQNVKILEEHAKAIAEGQTLQVDADYAFSIGLRKSWNKSFMGKLYQFDIDESYKPTSISATKVIMWLNNFNQKRILGINISSGLSNLFGSAFSANRLYKTHISDEDLNKAWLQMTSVAFYQSDDMKKRAALVDYFLPLLNNREQFKSTQLSVNQTTKILSQEWLMYPQRKTDEIVQLNVFFALMENTGLKDGQLVNLRLMAMDETGYKDRYSKTPGERSEIEKNFEKKLAELKKQYSIIDKATFKQVERNGKKETIIELPGVDRFSETVEELRAIAQTIAKDATGNMDEFDVANYRYYIVGRMFMTFKNWIPRMADVRFSEFHKSQSHNAYEYGRFRMFWRAMSANWLATASKLVPIPYITGKATKSFGKEDLIKRAIEVYNEKKKLSQDMGHYNEKEFITEGEFVDMFVKGVENSFVEFRTMTLLFLLLTFGIMKGDDDDTDEEKSVKKLVRRQIDKMSDEVGFFYSPKSMVDIAGQTAPIMGLVKDSYYLFDNVTRQWFGVALEEMGYDDLGNSIQERAKPMKYAFKVLPVMKEILNYIPIVDNDMAKSWGIKLTDKRGF